MNDRLSQKFERERIGEPCFQVVFGFEQKCPWCVADRVLAGETVRQEIKLSEEDQWFDIVNTPLNHADGSISHHALFYDISSRKKAEENLRESQKKYKELFQQFHTLLNGIPDSISLIDSDMRVVWANESTAKLSGGQGSDLSGKSCREYLPENTDLCGDCPVKISFTTGKTEEGIKNTSDGRIWGVKAFPLKDKAGKVTSVIRLASEITEKIKLREEATRSARLASLGELAAGIAHEINNPNGLILLNTPVLMDVASDTLPILDEHLCKQGEFSVGGLEYSEMREEIPSMHAEILDSANRIKRIVEDLKDFVRKDLNGFSETVNLNEVVRAAVRLVGNNLKKTTDNFVTSYQDNMPLVRGNSQRIEQVVVNLILNACQALSAKDKGIFVSTHFEASKNMNILKVCDEGVGISPDKLPHITDPFFTTKREVGGTGLGLSVSARIVKEHGGNLDFVSTPGAGTTVTLSLPLCEEV
jgi:PAS domain S-box-containing protein